MPIRKAISFVAFVSLSLFPAYAQGTSVVLSDDYSWVEGYWVPIGHHHYRWVAGH